MKDDCAECHATDSYYPGRICLFHEALGLQRENASLKTSQELLQGVVVASRDVIDSFEWWQVDSYDREFPANALYDLKAALTKITGSDPVK